MVIRKAKVTADQESYSAEVPLLLQWGGKFLPDLVQTSLKVDRMAINVSGAGEEKLLRVSKIIRGNGKEQANA
jgi:hypothetical protein